MTYFNINRRDDGIVILQMDNPGESANTMNRLFEADLERVVQHLRDVVAHIRGVVLTSAKKTFFVGADLGEVLKLTSEDAPRVYASLEKLKALFRGLETLGVPVVAAMDGTALGGGFEVALACHFRICTRKKGIQLGLPEVSLGLLPGAGGVTKMVRLLGLEKALPLLIEGKRFGPEAALKNGLVDELVDSEQELIGKAVEWIDANPTAKQPWDTPSYRIPGGQFASPGTQMLVSASPAVLFKKTKGNYPAAEAILCAAVEGAQVDFDTATRIESRYLSTLATSQTTKNLITAFFVNTSAISTGASRPKGFEKFSASKVGVLGAGMMGAGIAYSNANVGVDCTLVDRDLPLAERGKALTQRLVDEKLKKGRITKAAAEEFASRVVVSNSLEAFKGADLVVEAVYEDLALKKDLISKLETQLSASAVLASNTSTLPISEIAKACKDPSRFVGLHFFSPVEKMPLVEIVRGKHTSPETIAKAYDYVLQLRKTPIVVNDGRGFFTSRVWGTFVNEGIEMLLDGIPAAAIENAAIQSGMPVGPLAVLDEVSIELPLKIISQAIQGAAQDGTEFTPPPLYWACKQMVETHKRIGRAGGAGFYDYPQGAKKKLWSGVSSAFENQASPQPDYSIGELRERFLYIQALEAARCLQEGILENARDANVGSIMGLGYPAWTGGALQYIRSVGVQRFVQRSAEFAKALGARFSPPVILSSADAEARLT